MTTTSGSTRPVPPLWERLARRVASRFGPGARREAGPRRSKEERDHERLELRAQRGDNKRQADEARAARRRAEATRRDQGRLDLDRAVDAAYANYRRVRDWALHVRAAGGHLPLDDRDRQIAASLAPLWDADRATIASLRHWSDPVRGPQPSLAAAPPELGERLRRRVGMLRKWQLGHVLVPEVATLGKSGFMIGKERHSEESVRFALGTAALAEGGVLSAFHKPSHRGLVWEIGGGWGGFAYLFKTLCPNVTYVITGPLERLLVSASYLMSVYPAARCRFYGEPGTGEIWADWDDVDFVFAPESLLSDLSPPRLDLTIDIDELRGMAPARRAALVQRAHEWGSRYFYSMLPALAVDDPAGPWDVIARFYWPHPISLRTERSRAYRRLSPPEHEAAHLIGWKRMCL